MFLSRGRVIKIYNNYTPKYSFWYLSIIVIHIEYISIEHELVGPLYGTRVASPGEFSHLKPGVLVKVYKEISRPLRYYEEPVKYSSYTYLIHGVAEHIEFKL